MSAQSVGVADAAKCSDDRHGSIATQLEDARELVVREGIELDAE